MKKFSLHPPPQPPQTSSQTVPFPQLPLELREQIYEHAFFPTPSHSSRSNPRHIDFSASAATSIFAIRHPSFLPALAKYNEATRIELSLWFLRNAELGLLFPQYTIYLRQFLKTLPDCEGLAAIRRLDFQLFGRHVPTPNADGTKRNPFVRLMLDCPGLTQVRMKFEQWYLTKGGISLTGRRILGINGIDTGLQVMGVAELVDQFCLREMLDLKSLNKLTIEVWPLVLEHSEDRAICAVLETWACIEELAQWFRDGFKERGRVVEVRLVEAKSEGLRWTQDQGLGLSY